MEIDGEFIGEYAFSGDVAKFKNRLKKVMGRSTRPPTTIKFGTRDVAPFTLDHNSNEIIKGRALCCQVARLFVKYRNYSLVGKELRIKHPQQVKGLLIDQLKHS